MAHLKPKEILERAKEFLQCAEYAAHNSFFNVCAICSYAAMFWAARAALAREGFTQQRWEHLELQSKFSEQAVEKRRRYPPNFGTWLTDAYRLRNLAQYHFDNPEVKRIRRTVNHAKEFIHRVEEMINK